LEKAKKEPIPHRLQCKQTRKPIHPGVRAKNHNQLHGNTCRYKHRRAKHKNAQRNIYNNDDK